MPPILPYAILPPVYVEYDASAPDVAERVIELVGAAAPWARIDHIGSTAIPGCAGKGIIDLVALYPGGRLEAMRDTIAALGFQPQRTGHAFPADRPMRVGAIEHRGHVYRLHMHVVAADSDEAQSLYRFRDVLRSDPALRDAYQAKKRAILQSGVESSNDYTHAKGEFIGAVLSRSLHRRAGPVRIGVPRERKDGECRVALTPDGARSLVAAGHQIMVECGAGERVGFSDAAYVAAGARIAADAASAFDCPLVVKVKELQHDEIALLKPATTVMGFAQLARDRDLLDAVLAARIGLIGYETVGDGRGGLPLLAPMSRIAGRLAPLIAASLLMNVAVARAYCGVTRSLRPGRHRRRRQRRL
jgi:GrpB-like predicted nucleotidyltransferase (UPF0157 family)